MRYKVLFYPLHQETLVVYSCMFDQFSTGVDYVRHYTLKTPSAPSWDFSGLLRELADKIDAHE